MFPVTGTIIGYKLSVSSALRMRVVKNLTISNSMSTEISRARFQPQHLQDSDLCVLTFVDCVNTIWYGLVKTIFMIVPVDVFGKFPVIRSV